MPLTWRSADYGFSAANVKIDMKRIKARKDVGLSNRGVERSLRKLAYCRVCEAHARFVSPCEVRVGDDSLLSDRIVINVGG